MATGPKAVPKVVPVEAAPAAIESAPPKKSKKKLLMLAGGLLVLILAGGGGAVYFMGGESTGAAGAPRDEPTRPPVFLAIDPFTVNLQPENGDQFLQVTLTLQVADQEQVDNLKLYMPLLRSRLLLLLSSKKSSEISSAEGKRKLQEEIIAQVKQPFTPQGKPQAISGVFFTSFVIQ